MRKHRQWASPRDAKLNLEDVAYTLQVGRPAMEERLALLVNSHTELEEKLRSYLQDPHEGDDWYWGQVKLHDATGIFAADEDGQTVEGID